MRIKNIVAYLSKTGKYARLLSNVSDPISPSFLFELLFANSLEDSGVLLSYEVNVRSGIKRTVDFVHEDDARTRPSFRTR